ncbi:MAG: hypothetical protein IKG99_06180 [Bacteroidaceae bacterium]|nr:hypothetical protein [Bacteroidaceae bacterium]
MSELFPYGYDVNDSIDNFFKYMKKVLFSIVLFVFAIAAAQADVLGEYSFEGTLGDNIPVVLKFVVNGDEIAVGEIYYPKAKNPAPILVVGKPTVNGWYYLEEYQSDGTITGIMSFRIEGEDTAEDAYISEGTWTNPKTEKQFPMKNFVTVGRIDDVTKYLDYEDPQNIGREYAYSRWNPNYGAMLGGNVKFRGAGKYKLHFEVSNVPGNIAEGRSEPDRPAVLGETTHDYFYYENVNECGYGFSAHFFKKFVVLKTTTGRETLDCFGMGAAFDGVYIKVKQ